MPYAPGDQFYQSFVTQRADTAVQTDADSLPTGKLRRNGSDDLTVAVTVAHAATGNYTASGTIPNTYAGGDTIELIVAATVNGVPGVAVLPLGELESLPSVGANGANAITNIRDGQGNPVAGKVFYLRLSSANTGNDAWSGEPFASSISDINGLAVAQVELGASYQALIGDCSGWTPPFTVTGNPTRLPEIIG